MVLPSFKLSFTVIVLSLSGCFHFGYQIIILNPTQLIFRDFLNSSFTSHYGYELTDGTYRFLWALVLNMITFGCIIGTIASSQMLPRIGRKLNFALTIIISSMGSILCAISYYINSWEVFAIGRLILGIGLGITFCLQPVYFTEISPDESRGFLNSMTCCLVEIGFSLGSIIALPILLGTATLWPWLFWIELFPNVLALIVLPFLAESPKFLLANKNDRDGAAKSLKFFNREHIYKEISIIEKEIQIEQHSLSLIGVFRKPYLRKGLLISVLVQAAVQFSGTGAIAYFSTQMFEKAGVSAENAVYGTVGVSVQSSISSIIASFIVDRVGRRPLLLIGFLMLDIINVVFVVFFSLNTIWAGYVCIAGAVLYNFMFGIGPGVVQWFIVAELMPQNAKSAAITITMLSQWIMFAVATFVFLPLAGVAGAYSFFMFIVPLTAIMVYFYFIFPETKNKSILDIIALLGYKTNEVLGDDSSLEKQNSCQTISSISVDEMDC